MTASAVPPSAPQPAQRRRLNENHSVEDVLGNDPTAQRQLDQHARLLPIASWPETARFMAGRVRAHALHTLLTVAVLIASSVALVIQPRLIGRAVQLVASGGSGSGSSRRCVRR